MVEGSDLSQYINVFNHNINDLKRIDVKFEEEEMVEDVVKVLDHI